MVDPIEGTDVGGRRMGFALLTVRNGSVRWVRVEDRPRSIPWADGVEAVAVPAGIRLRRRGRSRGMCDEMFLESGRVVGLGGRATVCLATEVENDDEGLAFRFGPVLRSRSEAMLRAFHMAALAATVPDPVLIVGESGTGKELIARAIHDLRALGSGPGTGSFLALNMGAIPEDLAEAQLFGWVRGAFTGAVESRSGAFEAAGDGTLFLDEVGEASPAIQAKLLRAVEARTVSRVGSVTAIPVRARLVTATHRDLAGEVASGRFRLDLYERLACLVVRVPSLRERPKDLSLLAGDLLAGMAGNPEIEPEAVEVLRSSEWPGNVRSLRNVLHRAVLLALGGPVTAWAVREALTTPAPVPGVREPRCATRTEQIARSGLPRSTFYYRLRRGRIGIAP